MKRGERNGMAILGLVFLLFYLGLGLIMEFSRHWWSKSEEWIIDTYQATVGCYLRWLNGFSELSAGRY